MWIFRWSFTALWSSKPTYIQLCKRPSHSISEAQLKPQRTFVQLTSGSFFQNVRFSNSLVFQFRYHSCLHVLPGARTSGSWNQASNFTKINYSLKLVQGNDSLSLSYYMTRVYSWIQLKTSLTKAFQKGRRRGSRSKKSKSSSGRSPGGAWSDTESEAAASCIRSAAEAGLSAALSMPNSPNVGPRQHHSLSGTVPPAHSVPGTPSINNFRHQLLSTPQQPLPVSANWSVCSWIMSQKM